MPAPTTSPGPTAAAFADALGRSGLVTPGRAAVVRFARYKVGEA